jgi:hypothetical protein
VTVKPAGSELLEHFGYFELLNYLFSIIREWLGTQPHPHKLVIGGNHDWVLQALGVQEVQQTFDKYSAKGSVIYLEHEEASVGNVNVFGSPFGNWGGRNDAFKAEDIDYNFSKDVHLFVTHYPPILPKAGGIRECKEMVDAIVNNNVLLQVR